MRTSSRPCRGVRSQANLIALPRQERLEDFAHDLLVVDDENRTGPDGVPGHIGCSNARHSLGLPVHGLRHRAGSDGERQRKRKAGSLAERAVAGDRAAMFLDDAVGDGQTEAGAFADLLGREERIVDARELIRRNPGAGVGNLDGRAGLVGPWWRPSASRRAASRRGRSGTGSGTPAGACTRFPAREAACVISSLRTWIRPVRNWCSSSASTSLITALTSTAPLSVCAGRARLRRPLTIFAARNVCRSIFSSTFVLGSSGSAPCRSICVKLEMPGERRIHLMRNAGGQETNRSHLLGNLQLFLQLNPR